MAFTLSDVVPWGRTFDEYRAMFALSETDLAGSILGCGDGPASFNAEATARGHVVVSADPLYQFAGEEIAARVREVAPTIAEQARLNAHEFDWSWFGSIDRLIETRLGAMSAFLQDYEAGRAEDRYVTASLPELPFGDEAFALALCSHFLFLYSDQHDAGFHVRAIRELARVAREVRIVPLVELGARRSRHLTVVLDALRADGFDVERVRTTYAFLRGGDEMLRIQRPSPRSS